MIDKESNYFRIIKKGGIKMVLKALKLTNFRGYKDTTIIHFSDMTAFVGKNDVGKSTILEALDIFFNDGKNIVKMDRADINNIAVSEDNTETIISVLFDNLPEKVVIDTSYETSLAEEYLLNSDGLLEVAKHFSNGGSPKVYIRANHPTKDNCADLLSKKISELRQIVSRNDIPCENQTISSVIRKAIWSFYSDDLGLSDTEVEVTKEDAKKIWEKLSAYLPLYFLFQADRKNSDGDNEVQDPLKEAVKEILQDQSIRDKLEEVADIVKAKLTEVSNHTMEKLREMDPSVANSLNPVLPNTTSLKWADVFKNVSIAGDEIPINKRGSGVKRLILLNFFRAEAERQAEEGGRTQVIYAIEEPETSQHTANQIILIRALKSLAAHDNIQVIITTHSPAVVKELGFSDLKLIMKNDDGPRQVVNVQPGQLCYPSLNEINYIAFEETTIEYLNELYGYLEEIGRLQELKSSLPKRPYKKVLPNGNLVDQQISTPEYVRHQIHHPENRNNPPYTKADLVSSIELMRAFIEHT